MGNVNFDLLFESQSEFEISAEALNTIERTERIKKVNALEKPKFHVILGIASLVIIILIFIHSLFTPFSSMSDFHDSFSAIGIPILIGSCFGYFISLLQYNRKLKSAIIDDGQQSIDSKD